MNLILPLSNQLHFLLFFQASQISNLEIWVYRIAIPLSLLLIFLLFLGKFSSKQSTGKKENSFHGHSPRVSNENLKSHIDDLRNRIIKLENQKKISQVINRDVQKNLEHETEIQKNVLNKKRDFKEPVPNLQEEIPSEEIELHLEKENDTKKKGIKEKEKIYLSSPDKEKVFFAPEATLTPNEKTLYTVEDDNIKLYDRIDDQTMRLAFNSLDIFVKRVCDIINAREPQHSKIVMVEPGRVIKEKDDFLVLNKIKVKFE